MIDHESSDAPFDLPAMVDVVFILLAFFVLTSAIVPMERDFAASTADAQGQGTAITSMLPSVDVHLTRAGDGVAISIGPTRVPVESFADLTGRLNELALPETQVVLVPGPDVSVEALMQAADAVLASAMPDLAIARLGAR